MCIQMVGMCFAPLLFLFFLLRLSLTSQVACAPFKKCETRQLIHKTHIRNGRVKIAARGLFPRLLHRAQRKEEKISFLTNQIWRIPDA